MLLRAGSRSEEVSVLQRRLTLFGYPVVETGEYDEATVEAVKALQRAADLEADGICGPRTQAAIARQVEIFEVAERSGIERGSMAIPYGSLDRNRPDARGVRPGALSDASIPESFDKQGHYRLVTVNGEAQRGSRSNAVSSEMVLIDPQGQVVWRGEMVSGGWGRGALPGMDPSTYRGGDVRERPIIAEYEINYDGSGRRSRQRNPSFAYANGEGGFFMHLQNPDRTTMREIGGSGRNEFGIHPGGERLTDNGREAYSAGCMKMMDDGAARNFWDIMMSLPESQRPKSLEIVNSDFVGRQPQRLQYAQVEQHPESGHRSSQLPPALLASLGPMTGR